MSTTPVKVAVTRAGGDLQPVVPHRERRCSGRNIPVELRLLEITPALKALEGVVMELDDCASTLAGVQIGDDPRTVFDGVNHALLVGRPRGPGMERGDLLETQRWRLRPRARPSTTSPPATSASTVTGSPANTNALIAMSAPLHIPTERFSALTRLDHSRAISQLSAKLGVPVTEIKE